MLDASLLLHRSEVYRKTLENVRRQHLNEIKIMRSAVSMFDLFIRSLESDTSDKEYIEVKLQMAKTAIQEAKTLLAQYD